MRIDVNVLPTRVSRDSGMGNGKLVARWFSRFKRVGQESCLIKREISMCKAWMCLNALLCNREGYMARLTLHLLPSLFEQPSLDYYSWYHCALASTLRVQGTWRVRLHD